MAEDIRNRRLTTELENLEKVDSSKITFEKTYSNLDNGLILSISFNLKDHPYNPKLLTDQSELSLADLELDGEGDDHIEHDSEEEFSEPIDECEDREYQFELFVPKKFPFMFPQLKAKCSFSIPSLNDEQDLLEDMLGKQWHPFIILKDIVERVPQYVYKIKQREKEGTLYYACQSNYVLNTIYDLTVFNSDIVKAFVCNLADGEELIVRRNKKKTEELKRLERDVEQVRGQQPNLGGNECIENVEDERFKKYIILISDNAFLLFERPPFEKKDDEDEIDVDPSQLKFTMGKLVLWGPITSISSLKRNMEFKDKISIVWSKPVKNEDEFEFNEEGENEDLEEEVKDSEDELERVFETIIQVPNSDDLMLFLLDKMNKIKDNTDELKKSKILSMEVSSDSLKGKNVDGLLHRISIYEKEFMEKKTKEIAQELMDLYKKVIEYYSALGKEEYKEYVTKNHELMVKVEELE